MPEGSAGGLRMGTGGSHSTQGGTLGCPPNNWQWVDPVPPQRMRKGEGEGAWGREPHVNGGSLCSSTM